MGEKDFNRKECVRAFLEIGFHEASQRRGKHDKWSPPEPIASKLIGLQPRFIMVPRHSELHCQSKILKELKDMGGEDLVEAFKKAL